VCPYYCIVCLSCCIFQEAFQAFQADDNSQQPGEPTTTDANSSLQPLLTSTKPVSLLSFELSTPSEIYHSAHQRLTLDYQAFISVTPMVTTVLCASDFQKTSNDQIRQTVEISYFNSRNRTFDNPGCSFSSCCSSFKHAKHGPFGAKAALFSLTHLYRSDPITGLSTR
jgi:hypothetical protein